MGPSLAIATALLLQSPRERPADRLELEYEAPASCPSREELRTAIDTYLGRDQFGPGLDEVAASVVIERSGRSWEVTIDVQGPEIAATRTVEANDCGEAVDAGGLIVGVALDPLRIPAQSATPSEEPPQEREPEPEPEPEPKPEPEPNTETEAERALHGRVHAGVGVGLGFVGAPTAAVDVELALAGPRWRVGAFGRYLAPRSIRPFATQPELGIGLQGGVAGLRACTGFRLGPVGVPSCAGLAAGAIRGSGRGFDISRTASQPWVEFELGQQLEWLAEDPSVGVWIGAQLVMNVVRPNFAASELGQAFVMPVASGVLHAGFVGQF